MAVDAEQLRRGDILVAHTQDGHWMGPFRFIGIDMTPEYVEIAERRLKWA